jgi:hypothetical protein
VNLLSKNALKTKLTFRLITANATSALFSRPYLACISLLDPKTSLFTLLSADSAALKLAAGFTNFEH